MGQKNFLLCLEGKRDICSANGEFERSCCANGELERCAKPYAVFDKKSGRRIRCASMSQGDIGAALEATSVWINSASLQLRRAICLCTIVCSELLTLQWQGQLWMRYYFFLVDPQGWGCKPISRSFLGTGQGFSVVEGFKPNLAATRKEYDTLAMRLQEGNVVNKMLYYHEYVSFILKLPMNLKTCCGLSLSQCPCSAVPKGTF